MKIFLDPIEVPVKIGICPHEQDVAQRIVVGVELYADPKSYLQDVTLETIIDYSVLYNAITSWADRPQVALIEDYLKELVALCFDFAAVNACKVSIHKADVFGPKQGAGIEVSSTRQDWLSSI